MELTFTNILCLTIGGGMFLALLLVDRLDPNYRSPKQKIKDLETDVSDLRKRITFLEQSD